MKKANRIWMIAAILLICGASVFTACSNSDNPAVGPVKPVVQHEAWTQELIDSLNKNPEAKALLVKTIGIAKTINPSHDTNPAQTLDEFFDALEESCAEFPTYEGDWTDWWADGVGSTPDVVAHARDAGRKLNILRSLGNKDLQRLGVIRERARNAGIIRVQLNVVAGGIPDTGDAALCECGVAERRFALGQYEHPQIFRQMQRSIAACRACACNDNVIVLFEIHHENGSFDFKSNFIISY